MKGLVIFSGSKPNMKKSASMKHRK